MVVAATIAAVGAGIGLMDSLFGGDSDGGAAAEAARQARLDRQDLKRTLSAARLERSRALGPLFREIQAVRSLRRFQDPLASRANLEGIRGRAASETRTVQRASGLTGAPASALSPAGAGYISAGLDAVESARIKRFESTTQLLAGLTSSAAQISTAGTNTEISAIAGLADRSIAAATALGQSKIAAESERYASIFRAVGGAIGGFAAGGFFDPEEE